ncbi:MAG: glycosyltransferase family 2 protein [Anaerolineae bacterium]|nr:glycosyltransferase family 2 protein [Anaerolineae bacterium]MDQ7037122.1 glycosyltransferase family 2 protein [Anaerolineae bacterium]
MVSISIVIPVYKGAKTISGVIADLADELPHLTASYEAILVEDDGGDDSWQVIRQLSEKYAWVQGIKLMRNAGQHNALLCGIRAAHYDLIVTMDDDGQHPASEISKLLQKLDEGYDVVYGTPESKQHNMGRNAASFVIRFALSSTMGVEASRYASAFRVFRTYLRDAFAAYSSPYVSIDVLLTWGTQRFSHVFVEHKERKIGTSTYTLSKLVNLAVTMLTGFSVLPLRLASYVGFGLTIFGIILFIYVIPIRLLLLGYTGVPGFTFLASMITIFSGAQMFTIGIIGEYLARMHLRLMEKPPYVVHQKTGETVSQAEKAITP